MKELAKVSILVLSALFLFVGCHDDDGGGGGGQAVSTDPPPQVDLSVESFSAVSITDPPDPPDSIHNPEPSTMLLLVSGLLGFWGFRKKFKR